MFVSTLTNSRIKAVGLAGMISLVSAMTSSATDMPPWKITGGTIPVSVTLTDVLPAGTDGGPIYISIQSRENYRSMKGFGGMISKAEAGEMSANFTVKEAGEYAISVWHDRDDDGRFSMSESYETLDGWGASGTSLENKEPTFDDVKIDIPLKGTSVTIEMINPVSPS